MGSTIKVTKTSELISVLCKMPKGIAHRYTTCHERLHNYHKQVKKQSYNIAPLIPSARSDFATKMPYRTPGRSTVCDARTAFPLPSSYNARCHFRNVVTKQRASNTTGVTSNGKACTSRFVKSRATDSASSGLSPSKLIQLQ